MPERKRSQTYWSRDQLHGMTDKDLSMMSMESDFHQASRRGGSFDHTTEKIDSVPQLVNGLDSIFKSKSVGWEITKHSLTKLLTNVNLSSDEINKFTFWDSEKAYTRNMVATDHENYTLLLLCWNPGKESKIHNHPCDGCFVKTIRGCLREAQYSVHKETNEIRQKQVRFYNEGQVSFMDDDLGLHKIGNPHKDTGSVSLHLYTPPFKSCKVWHTHGVGHLDQHEDGIMGHFSVLGHRSPHLEGKPGSHAKVMAEILAHVRQKNQTRQLIELSA